MYGKIRTHEYPDLDAILCIMLLRYFGESKFPGIAQANLEFVAASQGFDQSDPSNKDTIAVDILGGHFDHHNGGKSTKCSAMLLAEFLEVHKQPNLTKILDTVNLSDTTGKLSSQKVEANVLLFTLFEMIRGWHVLHNGDHVLTTQKAIDCLLAMVASEDEWISAVSDAEKAIRIEGIAIKLLAFSSDSKAAMKAGRAAGGNVVIVEKSNGIVGITVTANQNWREPDLTLTAALLRYAVTILDQKAVTENELFQSGDFLGWFLHPSLAIVSHGSDKSSVIVRLDLSLAEIAALTAISLNLTSKWPERFANCAGNWRRMSQNWRLKGGMR